MAIIFLLPWLEEPENFDSCTEKCCPPIMRGSVVPHAARAEEAQSSNLNPASQPAMQPTDAAMQAVAVAGRQQAKSLHFEACPPYASP